MITVEIQCGDLSAGTGGVFRAAMSRVPTPDYPRRDGELDVWIYCKEIDALW